MHQQVDRSGEQHSQTEVDPRWFTNHPRDEMRVVADDPGVRSLVTGVVEGDSKQQPKVFR